MNFFKYFWFSCSGLKTYIPLLQLPLRASLFYWSVFSLFSSGYLMVILVSWFNGGLKEIIREADRYLPPFAITNGIATSALPQPYFSNTNSFPVILDTLGGEVDYQKQFPNEGLVIRSQKFEYWVEGSTPFPMEWKRFKDGEVNVVYLQKLRSEFLLALPFFYIILWLGLILGGIIQALIFTMFTGFVEKTLDPSYRFSQLFNIALFSLTPSSLAFLFFLHATVKEINPFFVAFAIYCFFVVMASGVCRSSLRPPDPNAREDEEDEF